MNSLKSLFFITVLAAVALGVYVSLNRKPDPPAPAGAPQSTSVPKIDGVPPIGADTGQASAAPAGAGGSAGGGIAPSFRSSAGANNGPNGSAPPLALRGGASPTPAAEGMAPSRGVANESGPSGPAFSYRSSPAAGEKAAATPAPSGSSPPADRDLSTARRSNLALPSDNLGQYNSPAPLGGENPARAKFEAMLKSVSASIDAASADPARLAEAHLTLSQFYISGEVPPEQARDVVHMLDQLAATVIYSRQYHIEPPYRVQSGDTLDKVAESYQVPTLLLCRINGVRDPQNLQPGRELKVLRGPFSAVVDLERFELTLMLKGRYAGRFPIGVGVDQPKLEGTYMVQNKKILPAYEARGAVIQPADPSNPLGKYLIDLGNQVGIHGTNNAQGIRRNDNRGTICLSERDIDDLFGILSVGSRVVIQR